MSHIPNSAMPHARTSEEPRRRDRLARTLSDWRGWASERAASLRERARDNPRVVIAAGVTAALGLVAAAALPMVRRHATA